MVPEIKDNLESIIALCRQMQVQSLYLFGSATNSSTLSPQSDIDFLLKYKRNAEGLPEGTFDYFELLFALEKITGRKVDLVVEDTITNPYFKESAGKNKIKIYEA